jgi:cellulose synthase/poly-beta-1,6-N-acetylglucosamine synthase-like glycosyltransferase
MITVIYSSNKDKQYNLNFEKHLRESIGLKQFEILGFENFGDKSLSQVYNEGLSKSQYDIIVCVHNDVVMGKGWGKKLLKDFSDNPEFGVIGKAGTCYFPESGMYWERLSQTMVGEVYHHPPGEKKFLSKKKRKIQEYETL